MKILPHVFFNHVQSRQALLLTLGCAAAYSLCPLLGGAAQTQAQATTTQAATNLSQPNKQAPPAVISQTTQQGEGAEQNSLLVAPVKSAHATLRKLSLNQCFELADHNNKEILVASSNLPIAEAAIIIARAIPNPTFSMSYGWGPAWDYVIAGNGQQFGWSEAIQVAGKRTKKTAVARSGYLQAALQLEAVRFDVHNRVRRAYAELAAAHAYADLIETQSTVALKLLSIAQKRFEAGKAPGSEALQARLAVMQFDVMRNQAWGRIVQDSAALMILMGEGPKSQETIEVDENPLFSLSLEKSSIVPEVERSAPPLEQLLPLAWTERPDLKAAIQQAYVDKKAITLAKTQSMPNPVVGFQYFFGTYKKYQFGFFDPAGVLPYLQNVYPNIPELNTSFKNPNPSAQEIRHLYQQSIVSGDGLNSGQNLPDIGKDRVPYQPGYQFTLQQELPIFYQYQGEIAQSKATWQQQLKQNDQLRVQIATDIVTAYESLLVSLANIRKYHGQILPAGLKVTQLTRRGYEMGKTDLATAILAQQQYQQLLSTYFDTVSAYQVAWANLEKAAGVPLRL